MAAQRIPFVSSAEYLELERKAEFKSEYHAGEIVAMSGASEVHNIINGNLAGALVPALRGSNCRAFFSDMQVAIRNGLRFVYPDSVVVCGERRFFDSEVDTLLNPTVIIEILSPSTESYDRGVKFVHYQQIDTLQEYVLISQTPCRVEVFRKESVSADGSEWHYTVIEDCSASARIVSLGLTLPLPDIYEGVQITIP